MELADKIELIIRRFEADSPDAGYGYEHEEITAEIMSEIRSRGTRINAKEIFGVSEIYEWGTLIFVPDKEESDD